MRRMREIGQVCIREGIGILCVAFFSSSLFQHRSFWGCASTPTNQLKVVKLYISMRASITTTTTTTTNTTTTTYRCDDDDDNNSREETGTIEEEWDRECMRFGGLL